MIIKAAPIVGGESIYKKSLFSNEDNLCKTAEIEEASLFIVQVADVPILISEPLG